MRPSVVMVGLIARAWVFAALPAGAQSIKDTVRQHVTEGLDSSGSEPDKKKAAKKRRSGEKKAAKPVQQAVPTASQPARAAEPVPAQPIPTQPGPAPPPPARRAPPPGAARDAAVSAPSVASEERLPLRVFGKNLELDAKIGAGMRGWYPEQYPLVSVDHASYLTWSVDLKAKSSVSCGCIAATTSPTGCAGRARRVRWWRATSVSSCPRRHGCSAPSVFH